MIERSSCEECKFFEENFSECRRHSVTLQGFPQTLSWSWCGEFEQKQQTKPEFENMGDGKPPCEYCAHRALWACVKYHDPNSETKIPLRYQTARVNFCKGKDFEPE